MAVILVDILGLERIASSFGLTVLFQGAAIVAGPPIAGTKLCLLAKELGSSLFFSRVLGDSESSFTVRPPVGPKF